MRVVEALPAQVRGPAPTLKDGDADRDEGGAEIDEQVLPAPEEIDEMAEWHLERPRLSCSGRRPVGNAHQEALQVVKGRLPGGAQQRWVQQVESVLGAGELDVDGRHASHDQSLVQAAD
jgi:hypothetical protein